jgi:hypothetical protein
MLDITRRKLIGNFGVLTLGVVAGTPTPAESQNAAPTAAPTAAPVTPADRDISYPLKGVVHGLGLNGRTYRGREDAEEDDVSVVTSLNLADGKLRQTPLNLPHGHAAMGMGNGAILCLAQHKNKSMVLDPDHKVMAEFISPSTHLFGGHGLIFAERGLFVLPMRAAKQNSLADHGIFQIYDLKTLKFIDQVDSGGLQPHEIHRIPGTDELATTHYGDISAPNKPFSFNVLETKLTILDAKTFRPKRHYPQPEFNAMVTHMRVDKDGWAYFVLTQYINFAKPEELEKGQDPFTVAARQLETAMGRKRTFPLPYQAEDDKTFPIPLPFVRVNTQTGERQIINTGDQNHLRSQSVAYSDFTGKAIALYYLSDNLVIHKPGQEPEVIHGGDLGLTDIRGVTEIPGTPLIAVMGTFRGVSVMDLNTRKVVAHFQTLNYEDTHLYHDANAPV